MCEGDLLVRNDVIVVGGREDGGAADEVGSEGEVGVVFARGIAEVEVHEEGAAKGVFLDADVCEILVRIGLVGCVCAISAGGDGGGVVVGLKDCAAGFGFAAPAQGAGGVVEGVEVVADGGGEVGGRREVPV